MKIWHEILNEALYTPSPHNVQPWRIRVTGECTAELLIDAARTLPSGDHTGSFIYLTMGMFVEAVRLSAAHRNLSLACTIRPSLPPLGQTDAASSLLPFARLILTPATENEATGIGDYDPALLRIRRTSRRADYAPCPVNVIADMALKRVAHISGQTYTSFDDPTLIEKLMYCNIDALLEDMNTPDYHAELVRWFRFSERQAERTRNGLSSRCMNTPAPLFWWAARYPGSLHLPLLRPLITHVYRRQLGVVPALGVIAGAFWEPLQAVEAGRFLLRFWLELARHDLYIHPFGNLVTNHRAAGLVREITGIPNIWLIFRIGYSPEPPVSYRRALEDILS